MSRLLVRIIAERGGRRITDENRRSAYGIVEGVVSVVVNTVLFAVKLALGLLTGSLALIADAVHTLADSVTSVVVIVSSFASRKPPDAEHPFGHGRSEAIATITVAALLAVAGFEFAKVSVERILHPESVVAPWWVIAVVLVTAAVKEWLSALALDLGRASGNTTLEADAWHHRSDVFATILVAAAMIGERYGLVGVDGWAGFAVAAVILKVAYDTARGAVDTLLGRAPEREEVEHVRDSALGVERVRGVHDIVIHAYGEARFISLHVEVADSLEVNELHAVSQRVEEALAGQRHGAVCVHVDPVNRDHPAYDRVRAVIEQVVADDDCAESFHDLRIVGDAEEFTVVFDVNLSTTCDDDLKVVARLVEEIKEKTGALDVRAESEPAYSYQV